MSKLEKYEKSKLRKSNKFVEYSNYIKLASYLADYGFQCSWLSFDDHGADFIGFTLLPMK